MEKLILFFAFMGVILSAKTQDTIASGTCGAYGNNLTWVLTEDSTLIVSGSGRMKDQNIGSWHDYVTQIKTVIIGDSVTSIGENAFVGGDNVTSVSIGNSVISIGWASFLFCYNLKSLTIPNSVTTIDYLAFGRCGFTSIVIGKSVNRIGEGAFSGCKNLDTIICKAIHPSVTERYTFDNVPKDVIVYVPCGSLLSYQMCWGFTNYIEEGETPVVPTNLSIADNGSSLEVTWQNTAPSYKVFRYYDLIATVDTNFYMDKNVVNGAKYCYMIIAVNEDCQSEYSEDVCKIFNGVGIVETHCNASLRVYPNPTSNQLRIKNYELREDTEIQIFDVVGCNVGTWCAASLQEEITINILHLASGLYFLKIDGRVVKIVKE